MHAIAFALVESALAQICGDRVFRSGSILEDSPPPSPFAVVRFGLVSPGMGQIKQCRMEVWVHNQTADYEPVDAGLSAVYGMLDGAEHVRENGEGSAELILAKWSETSGDLFDPGFRTVTKNSSYQLTGTGV